MAKKLIFLTHFNFKKKKLPKNQKKIFGEKVAYNYLGFLGKIKKFIFWTLRIWEQSQSLWKLEYRQIAKDAHCGLPTLLLHPLVLGLS